MSTEEPVVFECKGDKLIGILHQGAPDAHLGVVIVVGGPQYRVGSHRQFVLTARQLAESGIPVLRFDYRGMGDAEGDRRPFDAVDEDIRSAIDALFSSCSSLKGTVLYGLCDAASACLIYGHRDSRVSGLVLANPWVRTESGEAKSYLKYYYLQRLLQKSFWMKVFSGNIRPLDSAQGVFRSILSATRTNSGAGAAGRTFQARMLGGLESTDRPILFLISGRDLTAGEFVNLVRSDTRWKNAIERSAVAWEEFPNADHTMSAESDLKASSGILVKWCDGLRS